MKKNSTIYFSLITAIFFLFTSSISLAHFGSKGPYGGSVSCGIAYDTAVYLGTFDGGVYHSSNSQLVTWTPRPVGLKNGKIKALAHTGSYLFTVTEDGVYRFTGFVGNDRYWEKVNTGITDTNITSLCAIDSITLLAGTVGGSGVFKTTNKGATWVAANTGMLHFDVNGFAKAGARIIQISDGGLWASDDKAASWFDFTDVFTDDVNATAISYNTSTDEILVFNANGLFRLASASTTVTPAYVSVLANLPAGTVVRSISNNGTTWYLATDKGVFTSPASSISWTSENNGITTQDVTTVVPFQSRLVAGSNKEGIFKTSNSPISWTVMNNGFNNLATYSMITKDTLLVVAATEKGVFVSTNLATSYSRANNGLTDSLNVTDLAFFRTTLLASTKNAGVFMSSDTGKTWTAFNNNLSNLNISKIMSSATYAYIFNSSDEIFQSDLVSGWTMIQGGLPTGVKPTSMAFYSGFGNNILLGTFGHGIYTKYEFSGNWAQVNTGLTNLNITSVAIVNHYKIFAGTEGSGVFVSDLSTISWTATAPLSIPFTTTIGLDGTKIQAMAYYGGYVFASFRGEVLCTSDNGTTWIAAGTQFNLPSYTDINKISFVTTRVFASTQNNCLYSNSLSELPPLSVDELAADHSNIIIGPNPNNGTFTADYSMLKGKISNLEIYTLEGKLMEKFSPAQKSFSLNYPKGIYFLKVTTDKGAAVQKITFQ